jgi:hypothetical protein
MENQTGSLECSSIDLNVQSSLWEKRTVNGTHIRFLNKSASNQYINIENDLGYAEHSSINTNWQSNQWELEDASNILGLNETTMKNILIFPNPTDGLVSIKSSNPISNISIYDVQGKQVNFKIIKKSISRITFSVKNLETGIYFINIQNNFEKTMIKLIVE